MSYVYKKVEECFSNHCYWQYKMLIKYFRLVYKVKYNSRTVQQKHV